MTITKQLDMSMIYNNIFYYDDYDRENLMDFFTLEQFDIITQNDANFYKEFYIKKSHEFKTSLCNLLFHACSFENAMQTISAFMSIELEEFFNSMPYSMFINTYYWQVISEAAKEAVDYKCQTCLSINHLQVHHTRYNNVGKEYKNMDDLVVLCGVCHSEIHDKIKVKRK